MSAAQPPTATSPALHLTRWTVTSGSNVQSRGAVVIEAGDHHWRASAEGNGAVDALFKAVDAALADVLQGHPELVGYDVHALGQGPEAEGLVMVAVEPPAGLEGARSSGPVPGQGPEHEHHRLVDRGLRRGAQRDARRGALGGRRRVRRPRPAQGARAARPPRASSIGPPTDDTAPWFDR